MDQPEWFGPIHPQSFRRHRPVSHSRIRAKQFARRNVLEEPQMTAQQSWKLPRKFSDVFLLA
jgi:hypothetical protein